MKKTQTSITDLKTQAAAAAREAAAAASRAAELRALEKAVNERFQNLTMNCYMANEHLRGFLQGAGRAVSELGADRPMAIEERIEAVAKAGDVTAAIMQAAIADRLFILIDGVRDYHEKNLSAAVTDAIEFCEIHGFDKAATRIKTWHTFSPQTRGMSGIDYDIASFPAE